MDSKKTGEHPSYGLVSFTRVNSSGDNFFFGSNIPHSDYIELKIAPGVIRTGFGRDCFNESGIPHIVVHLTSTQFAELLTSMNFSSGVPCTVHSIGGRFIEKDENIKTTREVVIDEYKEFQDESLKSVRDKLNSIKNTLDKKRLTKQDKADILNLYKSIYLSMKSLL